MPSLSHTISYTLSIDGAPASEQLVSSIQTIQMEDHAELADVLRLKIAVAVREDGAGWTVIDDGIFRRFANLKLSARVGNTSRPLIDAYVIENHISFPGASGQSVMTVVAMDPTVLMNLDEKVKRWPNMADSDIAATIFGEYGFGTRIENTQPSRSEDGQATMQRGTDIQFLQRLAYRNGFECYLEMNPANGRMEGHFHPPDIAQQPQGVLTVNMGEATNVKSFQIRHDMLRPAAAAVKSLEADTLAEQSAAADAQSRNELGSSAALHSERPRRVLLGHPGLSNAAELQTLAQAVADRSSWAILAEGELNTSTYGAILRAKRTVEVRGVSRTFSGKYYVESVLHNFSADGYTQRFTMRRNATGLTGRERFREDEAL